MTVILAQKPMTNMTKINQDFKKLECCYRDLDKRDFNDISEIDVYDQELFTTMLTHNIALGEEGGSFHQQSEVIVFRSTLLNSIRNHNDNEHKKSSTAVDIVRNWVNKLWLNESSETLCVKSHSSDAPITIISTLNYGKIMISISSPDIDFTNRMKQNIAGLKRKESLRSVDINIIDSDAELQFLKQYKG